MIDNSKQKSIEQLQHLFEEGILTKEEFEQKKKMLFFDTDNRHIEAYLKQLDSLCRDGVITRTEFEEKKRHLKQYDEKTSSVCSTTTGNASTTNGFSKKDDQAKTYTFTELSEAVQKANGKPKRRNKDISFIVRVLAAIAFIVFGALTLFEPEAEPVEYSSSLATGETVYVNLVSLEPLYGTYREDASSFEDYSDVVCKCLTSNEEEVWVAIPYRTYIEEFDPSAKDSMMNRSRENLFPVDLYESEDTPQKIEYSSPKKIVAYVSNSESVAKDLEKKIGAKVLEYEDYLN